MKKLVLKIQYGGLGDHLLWSPIPRLAKENNGYDLVYISNFSDYRNPQTKKLVWEMNPYIDGFADEEAPTPNFGSVSEGMNILDTLMLFAGLVDDGIRFREPEIYYKPVFLPEYQNLVLYDPNYISNAGHPNSNMVEAYFRQNEIKVDLQFSPSFANSAIVNVPSLCVSDLFSLCDVLYSCKKFYCLTSGTATLCAAIGKPCTVLFHTTNPMFHHSKRNTYVRLEE